MFKKAERLSRNEFTTYFKSAKRFHSPALTILYFPFVKRKVAVVVGKKVARQAVRRNVLRRRIYATLRDLLCATQYFGVWIVIAKPTYNTLTKQQADEELRKSIAEVIKTA